MKILVDTNVLISAAWRDRLPEKVVLQVATHDKWAWLVTQEIFDEYVNVLRRPKFKLSAEDLEYWTNVVQSRTICVGSPPSIEFLRDPKDAPLLAAALATGADFLITGDSDLLQAQSLIETRIVTVAEFAHLFQID